jgi:C-terminal binding-module, SLH-like, of glucodextranase
VPLLSAFLLPLLSTTLLSVSHPANGARGDGSYQLPAAPLLDPSALELRELQVQDEDGHLSFRVGLGSAANPWNAPLGWSAGVLDIFVKSRLGGATVLADTGFSTPGNAGWQYHLRVSGFDALTEFVPDGATVAQLRPVRPLPSLQGSTLVVKSSIPSGQYSYWVTLSLYSPLAPGGVVRPVVSSAPGVLRSASEGAPTPLDVIAGGNTLQAYPRGILEPLGQTRDRRALLLAGLGGLGLLACLLVTALLIRQRA